MQESVSKDFEYGFKKSIIKSYNLIIDRLYYNSLQSVKSQIISEKAIFALNVINNIKDQVKRNQRVKKISDQLQYLEKQHRSSLDTIKRKSYDCFQSMKLKMQYETAPQNIVFAECVKKFQQSIQEKNTNSFDYIKRQVKRQLRQL